MLRLPRMRSHGFTQGVPMVDVQVHSAAGGSLHSLTVPAGADRHVSRLWRVGVQLELLMPVAVSATMPLSCVFIACWFVSFGNVDQRQPEQGRNRRAGRCGPDVPLAGVPLTLNPFG